VRSAAQRLVDTDKVLGVLPLGTVNRFARDLGMPMQLAEAVPALAHGRVAAVDVAEVNGRVYLCNSTLGLPSKFAQERQKLRGRALGERLAGYWHALGTIIRTRRRIAVAIDDGSGQRTVRALTVNVSNNLYAEEPSLWLSRPVLDGGRLGLYVSRHRTGLGLIWVLIRAALGMWRDDPKVDATAAERVVIDTHQRSVRVVSDGEIETLTPPLRYTLRPRALKVLWPKTG
jgi:diacylglycerol kinase family enzyme